MKQTAGRALRRGSASRPESSFRLWLLTILRHVYIDQLHVRREISVDDESAPWRTLRGPPGEVEGPILRDVQRAL